MKAGELRIGNICLFDEEEREIRCYDFGTWLDTNPEKYEPIPLTEEWLVKFGFRPMVGHNCKGWINGGPFRVGFIDGNEDGFGWNYSADYMPFYNYCGHKYVHQLQNLVHALTGEELTKK